MRSSSGRHVPEAGSVVGHAATHHLVCLLATVSTRDLDTWVARARGLLVGEEIVLEPRDEGRWQLPDVAVPTIEGVAVEDGDDLVVGLVAIDHPQPTHDDRLYEDIAV